MALLTVNAPLVGLESPASWGSKASIKGLMQSTWNKYGNYFRFASQQSGLSSKILLAFCVIESGGNPTAGGSSSATQGLMQFNKNYVQAQLKNEYTSGRLSDAEKQKLASYGFTFDAQGNTRAFTQADLVKPELNILIGSIILSQLADQSWATVNGKLRLDRILVVYNAGLYGKWGKIATSEPNANPVELYNKLEGNKTTRSYIAKMFGVGGALDIANNELGNVIA